MSLLIKVMGTGGIMDVHKKAAQEKGYVWYSYEGKVLGDKGSALKEIDNLLEDIMKCQKTQ